MSKERGVFLSEFAKGKKISWYIFLLSVINFIFWIFGHKRLHIMIPTASYFDSVFFFLNPSIFYKCFVKGEFLSLLTGAVNTDAFLFIVSYLIAIITFIAMCCLAVRLFIISWNISVRQFHLISCVSVIPVISVFFIFLFIIRSVIHSLQVKKKGTSRYDHHFEEEHFVESIINDLSEENLAKRMKTDEFGEKHYMKLFHPKSNFLKVLIDRLSRYLS